MSSIRLQNERCFILLLLLQNCVIGITFVTYRYMISTCWMEILLPKAQHRSPSQECPFNRASHISLDIRCTLRHTASSSSIRTAARRADLDIDHLNPFPLIFEAPKLIFAPSISVLLRESSLSIVYPTRLSAGGTKQIHLELPASNPRVAPPKICNSTCLTTAQGTLLHSPTHSKS